MKKISRKKIFQNTPFHNGTENENGTETTVNETLNSLANGNKYGLNNEIIIG